MNSGVIFPLFPAAKSSPRGHGGEFLQGRHPSVPQQLAWCSVVQHVHRHGTQHREQK